MVRLEKSDGDAIWMSPVHVVSLEDMSSDAPRTRIETPSEAHLVKGTPDEVHAKLFPRSAPFPIANVEAGVAVLERIADMEAGGPVTIHTILLARNALGTVTP